jgi:hypothetical protein
MISWTYLGHISVNLLCIVYIFWHLLIRLGHDMTKVTYALYTSSRVDRVMNLELMVELFATNLDVIS